MVTRIRYTRHSIRSLIARVAQDSGKVFVINECGKGGWETTVNHLQIIQCLQDGIVIEDPINDDTNQCWTCPMERYHAGQLIRVEIEVKYDGSAIIATNACASDAEWDE